MIIKKLEQGSEQWLSARRCKITGTKLKQVMGSSLSKAQLIAELIAERGTEQSKEFYPTQTMKRGSSEEKYALELFEKQTGKKVDQVGFCISDKYDWLALSPDGLIKDKKGEYTEAVEIKSPDSKTLILYKLMNFIGEKELGLPASKRAICGVPADYIWQVINYFIVDEKLLKLQFCSFDERFINEKMKLFIVEVNREQLQPLIGKAEKELKAFRKLWLKWEKLVLINNF